MTRDQVTERNVAAEVLGPLLKRWQVEAAHEWPDDREVLIARKLLDSDWFAAHAADHEAQIHDLLEEREELLTEIRRLRMGNHPAGRALLAVDRCPHDYAPCPFCPSDALAEALTERDAEHEGGGGA